MASSWLEKSKIQAKIGNLVFLWKAVLQFKNICI